MKLFRYPRIVPQVFQDLRADHRLRHPDRYVGAAEQSARTDDVSLDRQIEDAKARVRDSVGRSPVPEPVGSPSHD